MSDVTERCYEMGLGEGGYSRHFLPFQPLLLYFMSKQAAQNLSHNKATPYTQYHAKTGKQRPSEKILQ